MGFGRSIFLRAGIGMGATEIFCGLVVVMVTAVLLKLVDIVGAMGGGGAVTEMVVV